LEVGEHQAGFLLGIVPVFVWFLLFAFACLRGKKKTKSQWLSENQTWSFENIDKVIQKDVNC
jgi:hypothetical protein